MKTLAWIVIFLSHLSLPPTVAYAAVGGNSKLCKSESVCKQLKSDLEQLKNHRREIEEAINLLRKSLTDFYRANAVLSELHKIMECREQVPGGMYLFSEDNSNRSLKKHPLFGLGDRSLELRCSASSPLTDKQIKAFRNSVLFMSSHVMIYSFEQNALHYADILNREIEQMELLVEFGKEIDQAAEVLWNQRSYKLKGSLSGINNEMEQYLRLLVAEISERKSVVLNQFVEFGQYSRLVKGEHMQAHISGTDIEVHSLTGLYYARQTVGISLENLPDDQQQNFRRRMAVFDKFTSSPVSNHEFVSIEEFENTVAKVLGPLDANIKEISDAIKRRSSALNRVARLSKNIKWNQDSILSLHKDFKRKMDLAVTKGKERPSRSHYREQERKLEAKIRQDQKKIEAIQNNILNADQYDSDEYRYSVSQYELRSIK